MTPFTYARATDVADAVRLGGEPRARYLGGGTNLVDLMRETIERPASLVDVTGLSGAIDERPDGSLLIGAAARNTAVAEHRGVRTRYPLVARAIVAGASAQIRNMATIGGNLLQRTRCTYFYDDEGSRCNKRTPGQGCDAIDGFNRIHAILGASSACVATHPSDLCVALAAVGAVVHLESARGKRTLPMTDLHRLPFDHPEMETMLWPDELITAVELPALSFGAQSTYRKVRDRSSYAFALVSVAAALDVRDGVVHDVRLALGGVAHKPWRAWTAEAMLKDRPATTASFIAAAEAELADAKPLSGNAFKIELAKRTIVAVLGTLAQPPSTDPRSNRSSGSRDDSTFVEKMPPGSAAPGTTAQGPTVPGTSERGASHPGSTMGEWTPPGATSPGATLPGSTSPGSTSPAPTSPGPTPPGPTSPGSTMAESTPPGSTSPGATLPGSTSPGSTSPAPTSLGPTPPSPTSPGSTSPGSTSPGPTPSGPTPSGPTPPASTAPGPGPAVTFAEPPSPDATTPTPDQDSTGVSS